MANSASDSRPLGVDWFAFDRGTWRSTITTTTVYSFSLSPTQPSTTYTTNVLGMEGLQYLLQLCSSPFSSFAFLSCSLSLSDSYSVYCFPQSFCYYFYSSLFGFCFSLVNFGLVLTHFCVSILLPYSFLRSVRIPSSLALADWHRNFWILAFSTAM